MDQTPVVWSPVALAERDALHAYVATHTSPARAYAVLKRIVQAAARLQVFPESGRRGSGASRELVVPQLPYMLEYEFTDGIVRILHIWHTSRSRGEHDTTGDD